MAAVDVSSRTGGLASPAIEFNLLSGFDLRLAGRAAEVPPNVQRVLVYLALRGRPEHRVAVAAVLWDRSAEDRAAASLRTALWRARQVNRSLIVAHGDYITLGRAVSTDVARVIDEAHRLAADPIDPGALAAAELLPIDHCVDDLLPGWYDDWLLPERERMRQIRLHRLESLCRHFSAQGQHGLAIEAGLAAVAADPLRESAQRMLIAAYLAEGNTSEAVRQFDAFATQLREALDIAPSPATRTLVATCR